MFPVLFSIGSVSFKTASLLLFLSFFASSFVFWRKGREEHYDIIDLFDGFLLSALFGLVSARATYIVLNINNFGFDVLKWFDILDNPGSNLIVGVLVASYYLYHFAVRKKWDSFEVLDFWVTSISPGLVIYFIGLFFEGVGYGYSTNMPWGVVFPQLIDPHHPVQLYTALFYFVMYFYLSTVEYKYRTFSWYRYGKKTAQTGFLVSVFLILVAVFNFLITFLRPATFEFHSVNVDLLINIFVLIAGVLLLYHRSGRQLPLPIHRKPKAVRTKLENLSE
ncbi:prolipoprotein diacylglyceryl transferase [Patescibacteria group bacterium]|nr:prolipoprotein diacylglyceryl transferase [Patescibacteria group bacterium]